MSDKADLNITNVEKPQQDKQIKTYKKSFVGDALAGFATFLIILFVIVLDYQLLITFSLPIIIMLLSIVIKSLMKIWKLQLGEKSFMTHTLFSNSKFDYTDIKSIEIKENGPHKELLIHHKMEVMPINLSSLNVDTQMLYEEFENRIDKFTNKVS